MARLIAGAAVGKPFLEPAKVAGDRASRRSPASTNGRRPCCTFPNGIIAEVSCAVSLNQDNVLRILGTTGRIEVAGLLVRRRHSEGGTGKIDVDPRATATARPSRSTKTGWLYSFEADAAGEAIRAGRQEFACAGHELGRHASATCACSTNGAPTRASNTGSRSRPRRVDTISRHAARSRRHGDPRKRGIPGLRQAGLGRGARLRGFPHLLVGARSCSTPSSRPAAICSTPPASTAPAAPRRCSASGSATAACASEVGGHRQGRALAALLSRRDRQAADAVARPAADRPCRRLLHAPRQSGRAGRRVRRRHGRRGARPAASADRSAAPTGRASAWTRRSPMPSAPASRSPARSPTISRWPRCSTPIWPGCVASSDDDWKAWLTARQMPNFAWSSQGRGFFTDRAGRDKTRQSRSWCASGTPRRISSRRDRAIELAQRARQEPDPHRARLCAGAALPGRCR